MGELKFFDCSCSFGKRRIMNPGSFWQLKELVRKMKYNGIEKALVYHGMASDYFPTVGNKMLMEEIRDYPFLQGVWVVLPHHTGEFPSPEELRKEMKENGIKAVRLCPRAYGLSLSDWSCGDLFDMLEHTRVPLMISLPEVSWETLYNVLRAHPRLRLILTELHYNCGRQLYPILDKFENFYAETIGLKIFGGIEDICRKFGAERMIFGSSTPLYSAASAAAMINYARISDEEKAKIAGGNLERLLGEVSL